MACVDVWCSQHLVFNILASSLFIQVQKWLMKLEAGDCLGDLDREERVIAVRLVV